MTMEDLAEQSIDELLEIDGMDEDRARPVDHDGARTLVCRECRVKGIEYE